MSSNEVQKMFNLLAKNYDFANNIISFCTHKFFKKEALKTLNIENGHRILDLCCGSGDVSILIRKANSNCEIIGVDFSPEMLEVAKNKSLSVEFVEGNALCLPFEDNLFDIVVCAFGLRNTNDHDKALLEIKRVLKPKGQFLHIDFEGKSKSFILYDFIILSLLKLFKKDTKPFEYLIKSKNNFYTTCELINKLEKIGFKCALKKKKYLNVVSYQKFVLL